MSDSERILALKDLLKTNSDEPLDTFVDIDGGSINGILFDGVLYRSLPGLAQRLSTFPQEPCRQDDTLLMAYMKSGTHVTWQIAHMLLRQTEKLDVIGKIGCMLEGVPQSHLNAIPSPRVINTHLSPKLLPRQFSGYGCKIIYVVRNPKDVVVSCYNHMVNRLGYCGTFAAYFELFMEGKVYQGGWFQSTKQWHDHFAAHPDIPVHIVYYEDVVYEKSKSIRQLAEFMNVECSDELLSAIIRESSFECMKRSAEKLDLGEKRSHTTMFRKGVSGDWKNWLTVAQNERFNAVYAEKIPPSFNLNFKYMN